MATTVTLEDLQKIVADIGIAMKKADEAREESERARAEAERARAEFERARVESERARAEADERRRERDRAEHEEWSRKESERFTKEMNRVFGRFGNTIGYITEMILLPGIRKKMAGYGHKFDTVAARKEFFRKNSANAFAEADLILENGVEVMAVEVKTRLTKDDVRDHLERLNRLRENEKAAKVDGKALISGVAGITIDKAARKMAKKYGMYIIQIVETDQNITVDPPEKVGRW